MYTISKYCTYWIFRVTLAIHNYIYTGIIEYSYEYVHPDIYCTCNYKSKYFISIIFVCRYRGVE